MEFFYAFKKKIITWNAYLKFVEFRYLFFLWWESILWYLAILITADKEDLYSKYNFGNIVKLFYHFSSAVCIILCLCYFFLFYGNADVQLSEVFLILIENIEHPKKRWFVTWSLRFLVFPIAIDFGSN